MSGRISHPVARRDEFILHIQFHHVLCVVGFIIFLAPVVYSWGFWTHREITREAIRLLPSEMAPFFERHSAYIVEHSVDPDRVRETDSLEQFQHYIDIDKYGSYPFEELPRSYEEAVAVFGEDTLRTFGLLPWRIEEYTVRLTDAMKQGDVDAILHAATFLCHYVADAHVPLHATLNYDGQLTDQDGLHSRFESEIPRRNWQEYRFTRIPLPKSLDNPLASAFEIILESYQLIDTVLSSDRIATSEEVSALRGGEKKRSDNYYFRFAHRLGEMPEKRIAKTVHSVASFWFTAWRNAGSPVLPG